MKKVFKQNIFFLFLLFFSLGIFLVALKMNIFRYQNFDFGKFDLGNMTQMIWNTLHGRLLYLTDYFGTNLPRWAMSHVDPILLLFVPIFALYQHALTLVVSQLILVIFSSLIIYKIAKLELGSDFSAMLWGLAFLFYPAVGFIIAWTGFHGVTLAIPFFLGAFYVFEKMHKLKNYSWKNLTLFWVLLVICMSGKEEIPLFIFLYGLFILFFRTDLTIFFSSVSLASLQEFLKQKTAKTALMLILVSLFWFLLAFFVIIPKYSHYRVEGYKKFAESLQIDERYTNDVLKPNYFISRYEGFGEGYSEILKNMFLNPKKVARVAFSGDKIENMKMTFGPLLYTPLFFPPLFIISLPELVINYTTTAGGIGTSEIYNHRISMIIPVLFISGIFGISYIGGLLADYTKVKRKVLTVFVSALVLAASIYTTFSYENPVYLWITQAIQKRISAFVQAKTDEEVADLESLKIGDRFRISKLETKDRECAGKVVNLIPEKASVSGPDYLGAHLAKRETYAIFPALYNSADYVVVDVFSRKVLRILDIDVSLVNDVVGRMVRNENYKLNSACGNLFIFERVIDPQARSQLLPLQEKFDYPEKTNLEIFQSLFVVDYELPREIERGVSVEANFVYSRKASNSLDGYVLFLTFINEKDREMYQVANLPSFGISELKDWKEGYYYLENVDIAIPVFVEPGSYKAFIGMSNNIRSRSIYLGDVIVE